jgi:aerobic carbon-monoxide dehydrogenase small subunit
MEEIILEVNGHQTKVQVEPRMLLADALRDKLGLVGTHVACGYGTCGACTVQLDGEPIRSCLMFAVQADGHKVTTVEGLGTAEHLHPVQQAFWEEHGLQCGYCTSGFLMTVEHFLRSNPHPSRDEIRQSFVGNLCRCTGYQFIVNAVERAAAEMNSSSDNASADEGVRDC